MSKTTVSFAFENLNLPDKVIHNIMESHGNVYGIVPREIWDMLTMPESLKDDDEVPERVMVSTTFHNIVSRISHLIKITCLENYIEEDCNDPSMLHEQWCILVVDDEYGEELDMTYRTIAWQENLESAGENLNGDYQLRDSDYDSYF